MNIGASIRINVGLFVDCVIPFPSPRVIHTAYVNEVDEDGDIIVEMLATNLNDAHEIQADEGTLVGRTDEGYGAVQRIKPILPLFMENKELKLDITDLQEQVSVLQGQVSNLQINVLMLTRELSVATINLILAQSPVARFNANVKLKVNITVV